MSETLVGLVIGVCLVIAMGCAFAVGAFIGFDYASDITVPTTDPTFCQPMGGTSGPPSVR